MKKVAKKVTSKKKREIKKVPTLEELAIQVAQIGYYVDMLSAEVDDIQRRLKERR